MSQRDVTPEDIALAAAVVVRTALRLAARQRLVIFADHATRDLANALYGAAKELRARTDVVWLDPLRGAPLKIVPDDIVEELATAQASAFVAASRPEEQPMRQHLLHLISSLGLRHAHMPGIGRVAFARGLAVDYRDLAAAGRRVQTQLARARELTATCPGGTDLHVALEVENGWSSQLGVLEMGRFSVLPAGALYAKPADVDGIFVASASLGEFFGTREGVLRDKPVRFTLERGRVTNVEVKGEPKLQRDLQSVLSMSRDANRVTLVAVGVNSGIGSATGEVLVDQNLPSLHLGIGDAPTRTPGAAWGAQVAFAACAEGGTLCADETLLIEEGKLVG